MPTKDETAQILAEAHFQLDQGVVRVFRIVEPDEANESRPVKLLEVNRMTTEAGILPIGMGADPSRGVAYGTIIVEITPNEFERLAQGQLQLPNEWRLDQELLPHAAAGAA